MALICLVFMGLFQVSQMFAAREILNHAAARGSRAKTVGFNWWMVEKAVRVASIPNAGRMVTPEFNNDDPYLENAVDTMKPGQLWVSLLGATPSSLQYNIERARIPAYLYSYNSLQASHILNYADWDTIHYEYSASVGIPDGTEIVQPLLTISVYQDYPLWVPMHRAFYADDSVKINSESTMENHYELYIEDMFW